jgi:hypothetical protein
MRKDEFEYPWGAHIPSDQEETEGDRWGSPEPPQPSSEEDEEEVQYLTKVLGLEPRGDEVRQDEKPVPAGVMACPGEGSLTSRTSGKKSPHPREAKRRKPRKKVTNDKDQEWEWARQDAWLREMLTDTSDSEAEERFARFAESGRWIAEMTGIPLQTTTT